MNYRFGPYSALLLVATGIALVVAAVSWQRRRALGAVYLALLGLAAAEWAFCIVFEAAATTVPLKLLWSKLAYPGTTTAPLFFFLFAWTYAQRGRHLTRRAIGLLSVVPVLTVLAAATNEWHHWVWTGVVIRPETGLAVYGHGPWFWVFFLYTYALLLTGIVSLLRGMYLFPAYYRHHMASLLLGMLVPVVGNVVYVSGLNPIPGVDWTPVTFAVTGAVVAWGLFRQSLLTLVPIARERLIEEIPDGVLVLDAENRVVDVNPAAQEILDRSSTEVIGRPLTEVQACCGWWADSLEASEEMRAEEISLGEGTHKRYYDLRMSPLRRPDGKLAGRLVVMRDISRRKQVEEEREALIGELQDALAQVKTLSGLLPICSNCKRIRDSEGQWHSVEAYIRSRSEADFSHGICPECARKLYPEFLGDEEGEE